MWVKGAISSKEFPLAQKKVAYTLMGGGGEMGSWRFEMGMVNAYKKK